MLAFAESYTEQVIPELMYARACVSQHIADLAEIYNADVNLCIAQRAVASELETFVKSLLASGTELSLVEHLTFKSFDFYGLLPQLAHLPGHRAFCADIATLSALYADLFGLQGIGLRLRTLDKPMCPKFHVDSVTCRLVCTYGGIGTEWLADNDVNRTKLGMGSGGLSDAESGFLLREDAIQTMSAYAIGLLKGSAWEGNEQHGAVHRSPQVTSQSPRRLLLTLDFG
ncbi:MAG: DUF1826 domain-containing protein [Methylococcaceae bacterium]